MNIETKHMVLDLVIFCDRYGFELVSFDPGENRTYCKNAAVIKNTDGIKMYCDYNSICGGWSTERVVDIEELVNPTKDCENEQIIHEVAVDVIRPSITPSYPSYDEVKPFKHLDMKNCIPCVNIPRGVIIHNPSKETNIKTVLREEN